MAGVLAEVYNVRTHGNGCIRSPWDEILLLRDLEQLVAEGLVKVVRETRRTEDHLPPSPPDGRATKCFQDSQTGEIYEYREGWERGGPCFDKIVLDERFKVSPQRRPI